MEKVINVDNNIFIRIILKDKRKTITISNKGIEIAVVKNFSFDKTNDIDFIYDNNYILICNVFTDTYKNKYTKLLSVYDIGNGKELDIQNEDIKELIERTYINSKAFKLGIPLSIINNMLFEYEKDKNDFISYVTNNNSNIKRSDVINYIIENYPEYKKLGTMSLKDIIKNHEDIYSSLDNGLLYFKVMPEATKYTIDNSLKTKRK